MDNEGIPASPLVEVSLSGVFKGMAIRPENVPFPELLRFPKEVAEFVAGSNQVSLLGTSVQIADGSLRLAFDAPKDVQDDLDRDFARLGMPFGGNFDIDPQRGRILNRWQRRAKLDHNAVRVRYRNVSFEISDSTDWKFVEEDETIPGEFMILGEVEDAGGDSPNIHVLDAFSKKRLIVSATREQIRSESHPVYNRKLLHVSAEQVLRTGEKVRARLIRFVNYRPEIDEERIHRMIDRGTQAWAGITDAAKWIHDRRNASDAT